MNENIGANRNLMRAEVQTERMDKNRGIWLQWLAYLTGMPMYMTMVVTDWGSADIFNQKFNLTTDAWTSKLVMGGVVSLFYLWTLIAPRVCPHRNFYFE